MSVLHEPGERGGRREGSVDECDLAWSETGAWECSEFASLEGTGESRGGGGG